MKREPAPAIPAAGLRLLRFAASALLLSAAGSLAS